MPLGGRPLRSASCTACACVRGNNENVINREESIRCVRTFTALSSAGDYRYTKPNADQIKTFNRVRSGGSYAYGSGGECAERCLCRRLRPVRAPVRHLRATGRIRSVNDAMRKESILRLVRIAISIERRTRALAAVRCSAVATDVFCTNSTPYLSIW
jgi:hypothetical protein